MKSKSSLKVAVGNHPVLWITVAALLGLSLIKGYLWGPQERSREVENAHNPSLAYHRDAGQEAGYKSESRAVSPPDVPLERPSSGSGGSNNPAAILSWDSPDKNADGTPLTDLAGFKVHYGGQSGQYTEVLDVGPATTCTLNSLPCGRYYFTVSAYDKSGNESQLCSEVWKDVQ
jgi:hypothetical protein